jgi:K+-transporting ATPase ATPase C chain
MTMQRDVDPPISSKVGAQLRSAVVVTATLLLICGVAFPIALFAVGRIAFPHQATGSLLYAGASRVVGSALIGQSFVRPEYFHGRPSVTRYDAANSSGSNLGPTNPQLVADVRRYAERFRAENDIAATVPLPIDAVTASGSGLDPHISPANAALQASRVARARAVRSEAVRALVDEHTEGRQLGVLGEPRVNVLLLNLALDSVFPGAGKMRMAGDGAGVRHP